MIPHVNALTRVALVAALCAPLCVPVSAQTWPAKPVKIIVPAPAGTAPDIAARAIADKLGEAWGQALVVDNKPGAGCGIAVEAARKAAPDGYTLLLAQAACVVVSPLTFKSFKADMDKEFTPLSIVGVTPMMIVATPAAQAKTLKDIVAQARANPDKVTMGNPALTSIPHLTAELIAQRTGVKLYQIPLGASGVMAAARGDVEYALDGVATMLPMVKAGKTRAIAVTAEVVHPGLEGYALAHDSVPGLDVYGWFALMTPQGLPDAIKTKINSDVNKILSHADVLERFAGFGTYPRPGSLQDAAIFVKKEQGVWAKVIKEANIQPE
jgi:tripartite-type tricarboxylate transporter receptor subunit TctC